MGVRLEQALAQQRWKPRLHLARGSATLGGRRLHGSICFVGGQILFTLKFSLFHGSCPWVLLLKLTCFSETSCWPALHFWLPALLCFSLTRDQFLQSPHFVFYTRGTLTCNITISKVCFILFRKCLWYHKRCDLVRLLDSAAFRISTFGG